MIIVGIDPGLSGGIAWYDSLCTGHKVGACNMPGTLKDISDFLKDLNHGGVFYQIEDVGKHVQGNNASASAKFCDHVGSLKGILTAIDVSWDKVPPAKWEHWFIGKPNWPRPLPLAPDQALKKSDKGKFDTMKKVRAAESARRTRIRKNLIKEKAQRLYPHVKVTLATADALGILTYAMGVKGVK